MQYKVEKISPKKARLLLKGNIRNRGLKHHHVKFLAAQMTAGNWQENGQAIVVDVNDVLLDGQHRLEAVIQSEVTVLMLVVRGAAPEVMNSIDTGSTRGAGDVFGLNGVKNANAAASIANILMAWDIEVVHGAKAGSVWSGAETKPSNDDLYKYYLKKAKDYQWAVGLSHQKKLAGCNISQAGVALMILSRKHSKAKLEEFAEKIRHGGDYTKSPTHFLPGWVQKRRDIEIKTHRYEQLYAILYCFERWIAGDKVQGLRINKVFDNKEHYYSTYNKIRPKKAKEEQPELELVG